MKTKTTKTEVTTKPATIEIPHQLSERIEATVHEMGESVSEFVNRALKNHLAELDAAATV